MSECVLTGPAPVPAISMLTTQHRDLERLWSDLRRDRAQHVEGQRTLLELVRLLSQHDALEMRVVYPELRMVGGEPGRRLAEQSADEHRTIRESLSLVDGRDLEDPVVFTTLSCCMATVADHFEEEEQEVLPILHECCSLERLVEMEARMELLLTVAPTHPQLTLSARFRATAAGGVTSLGGRARKALRERG